MKTKIEKRVNHRARQLNKSLKADVFGNRFWIRQYQKSKIDGILYFLYELCDREQPDRNKIIGWYNEFALDKFNDLWIEMNDFITTSDFWSKYKK